MSNVSSSNGLGKYPKLRFQGFFEPWSVMKLSDFTTRIMRKNTTNATDIPLTISSKDGLINQNDFFNKQVASKDMSGYYLLHRGEYAYNKSYSVGYDFGSIKRLEKYDMGALSTLYICFALTKFSSDFIKHYFDSLKWYREIYMISAEGARNHGLLNVPTEDFFATLHTLPTDEAEQAKIASFLDALTARIEKQRSLVENLKKYKRGLLKQVFNENCTWDEVPLGKIATIYQPQTISSEQLVENGKYPVYGANGQIGWYNDFNHDSEQIAICCRGASCGTVNYIPAYSWITGNAMVINIADSIILKKFVYHQLCSQNLSYMISGSGQPQIVRTPCVEHKIFVPTSEVQAKITALFDLLDQKIAIQEKVLDTLIITKKGYLQKLFV